MVNVLENFERWKEFLGDQVDKAHAMGMTDEQITKCRREDGPLFSK